MTNYQPLPKNDDEYQIIYSVSQSAVLYSGRCFRIIQVSRYVTVSKFQTLLNMGHVPRVFLTLDVAKDAYCKICVD